MLVSLKDPSVVAVTCEVPSDAQILTAPMAPMFVPKSVPPMTKVPPFSLLTVVPSAS